MKVKAFSCVVVLFLLVVVLLRVSIGSETDVLLELTSAPLSSLYLHTYSPVPPAPHSADCVVLSTIEHGVSFRQVRTYVGKVELGDIRRHLEVINKAFLRNRWVFNPEMNVTLELCIFAMDGTLLNLLRWGQVVNDDDVDIGFFFKYVENRTLFAAQPLQQYRLFVRWLFEQGLLGSTLTERELRHLHNSKRDIKPRRCWHRGQLLQCRLDDTNVHLDAFGPDTVFSQITGITLDDVLPLQRCAAWNFSFPCPKRHILSLTRFSINIGTSHEGVKPWYEFAGCALFPRDSFERSSLVHLNSVVNSGKALARCGFPTLLEQLSSESIFFDQTCVELLRNGK